LWAIEKIGEFEGEYHVLGGKLSALDGITPADLNLAGLYNRLKASPQISEVIFAMSADIDGQTTMFFAKDKIEELGIKMTALSQGIPSGGDFEYLDDGTIITAFRQRHII
jgi:recombination protein RecR